MKFKLFLLALAMLPALPNHAGNYLEVLGSGNTADYKLSTVQSITFSGGNILIKNTSGEVSTKALVPGTQILFTDTPTGISQTVGSRSAGKLRYDGRSISCDGITNANAQLFNASGQCLNRVSHWNGSAISVENLPSGFYIFKVNNQSVKFVKQ